MGNGEAIVGLGVRDVGPWFGHLFETLAGSIPTLLSALFVLFVGGLLALLVGKAAEVVARNAAVSNLRAVGRTFRGIIFGIAALAASDRLGFDRSLVGILILIAVGSIFLALAIAFGLGARSLAKRATEGGIADLRGEMRGKARVDEAEGPPDNGPRLDQEPGATS